MKSITTCLAVLLAPASVAAQTVEPTRYGYGPWMMDWGGGWFGMLFGPFFMILILATVVMTVVLLVRWFGGPIHGSYQGGRAPIDILKERYARGEIDKAEFDERRRVLAD